MKENNNKCSAPDNAIGNNANADNNPAQSVSLKERLSVRKIINNKLNNYEQKRVYKHYLRDIR